MKTALIIATVCLLFVLLVILIKYFILKKEIRRFSKQVDKLKDELYEQPLKLNTFDKDIVNLANSINQHVFISRKLSVEYKNAQKNLNNVISGISHDFRTPLTASLGYLQMIEKSGELSDNNKEYLNVAISKNKYLKELSDEFFEITATNKDEELPYENINLSNIISEHILLQYDWILKEQITPEIKIEENLHIDTVHHYLTRIIENLFSNAQKYTLSRFFISLEKNNKITLTVTNDIHPEEDIDVSKVFDPFFRASSRTGNGTGLGLYVVKNLCDKLGYDLSADITKDKLFTIKITF